MKEQPLVSVLMTAYNREKYIAEAIESVLASTYKNFELIIVDDCSADNTVSIARSFEQRDNRVKVFVNAYNLGDYPNRNKAASYATGKYLKYLDSDDIIYPYSLDIMVNYMEDNPDVAFAFCDNAIQNNSSAYPVKYFPDEAYRTHFLNGGLFYSGPGATIISREIFVKENGFSEQRFLSDTAFIMRLALQYPILKIQTGLIWWRIHQKQEVAFERKHFGVLADRYKISVGYLLQSGLLEQEKKQGIHILKKLFARNIFKVAFQYYKPRQAYKIYMRGKIKPGDMLVALDVSTAMKKQLTLQKKYFKPWIYKIKEAFKELTSYVLNKIPSKTFFNLFLKGKTNKGAIIVFHRVLKSQDERSKFNTFIEISAEKFEEVILNLKKLKVRFVSLKDLQENIAAKNEERIAHISFDDGYDDNYDVAFRVLKKHNICFSIFVTTDFINNDKPFLWWYMIEHIIKNNIPVTFEKYDFEISEETYQKRKPNDIFKSFRHFIISNIDSDTNYLKEKLSYYASLVASNGIPGMLTWQQINEMLSSGLCEVAAHTKSHIRFASHPKEVKIMEIEDCKKEILNHTGVDTKYFAFPYGDKKDIGNINDLEEIMHRCDIDLAFTTIPGELNTQSSKYLLPRVFLNDSANIYTLKTRINGHYQRRHN